MKSYLSTKFNKSVAFTSTYRIILEYVLLFFLVLLVGLSILSCSNFRPYPTSKKVNYDNLKGKVRSVEETDFEAIEKFGKYEVDKIIRKTITKFNYQGKKVNETEFFDGINMSSEGYYKYDGLGYLTEEITKGGSWENRFVYTLNSRGKRIEENYFEHDGTLKWRSFYNYDSNGFMIEETSYNGNGDLKFHRYYKYDKKGNKIEECLINMDGNMEENYSFTYDNSGNLVEEKSYEPKGGFFNNFKINSIKHKKKDPLYYRSVYEYLVSTNCILHTHYPGGNSPEFTSTFYKSFDKYDNWQIKTQEEPVKKKMTITERKIEYY
jgi:hypothetical protein